MQFVHYPKRINLLILLSIPANTVNVDNSQAQDVQKTDGRILLRNGSNNRLVVGLPRFEKVQIRFEFYLQIQRTAASLQPVFGGSPQSCHNDGRG